MNYPEQSYQLLMVDDALSDQIIIRRAIEDLGIDVQFSALDNALDLVSLLKREGRFGDPAVYPWPDLILLDINMPSLNGIDALKIIRDLELYIPVVMLTTSDRERDIQNSYKSGANAYIVKPFDDDKYALLVSQIHEFWSNWVQNPSK